ncbi:serine hydrolase domain-containing protein [Aestuariibacter salexigens]|uniref:serine hydrolase domain-containing protein n=1 Tax=Aestuariibacter salexigens TaxID=226010 RepID=UPI000407E808|nr:serine hydrolase domain-containing protein [Aestuariibacter salexigens]
MRRKILLALRLSLLAVGIGSLAFVPWTFVLAWLAPLPDTVQQQVSKVHNYDLDGIIVYVDQAGVEPQLYAAGWKNRENRIPADPDALFKIGSISKLYIAVAAAKLIVEEKLSLDTTLAEFFPEYAERIQGSASITLRMMIGHTSGLTNYTDHPDYPWSDLYKHTDEVMELILDQPANFLPGTAYGYSNTNYYFLGRILDNTLGYSHHRYIREQIVEKLGLQDTYSLLDEVNADELTSGYFVGYEADLKMNSHVHAGGSMIATARDVGVFIRALNDGSLLSQKEQEVYNHIYSLGHTGSLPGYSSQAWYHEDIDTVVVQLVNTGGGMTWNLTELMYNRIVDIIRKKART